MRTFYSDSPVRDLRADLVSLISKGPARELDAYLTYISDVAYLSHDDFVSQPLEMHRKKLVFNVYKDQFELSHPALGDSEKVEEEKTFFFEMSNELGVRCVENVIALGLDRLKQQELSAVEIKAYAKLNDMICNIAENLEEEKRRKFWMAWVAYAKNFKEKEQIFMLGQTVKEDLKEVRTRLNKYSESIKCALETQKGVDL